MPVGAATATAMMDSDDRRKISLARQNANTSNFSAYFHDTHKLIRTTPQCIF